VFVGVLVVGYIYFRLTHAQRAAASMAGMVGAEAAK